MDPLLSCHPGAGSTGSPLQLDPPFLTGWSKWQSQWVDRIKRIGLKALHASAAGERLVLRIYWVGEQATELALRHHTFSNRPDWLERQMAQHLAEEERHSQAFARALCDCGAQPGTGPSQADGLSRFKIWRWKRLANAYSPRFAQGALVPAFAIGLCAEQMATRVLTRHCDVIGDRHPMYPLLTSVLADEARHVRVCKYTLACLVQPEEQPILAELLADVRAVDRAFGITGALGLMLAGWSLRLTSGLRGGT